MAVKRYERRTVRNNSSELITKILESKNIKFLKHYAGPKFNFPTYEQQLDIPVRTEIWKLGDNLSKYAEKYYLNAELWWLIGAFNKKPTDAHFKIGDIFYIPTDLNVLFDKGFKV